MLAKEYIAEIEQRLTAIAAEACDVPTLERRGSDQLDFHTVAAWQLKSALWAAYNAGFDDGREVEAGIGK